MSGRAARTLEAVLCLREAGDPGARDALILWIYGVAPHALAKVAPWLPSDEREEYLHRIILRRIERLDALLSRLDGDLGIRKCIAYLYTAVRNDLYHCLEADRPLTQFSEEMIDEIESRAASTPEPWFEVMVAEIRLLTERALRRSVDRYRFPKYQWLYALVAEHWYLHTNEMGRPAGIPDPPWFAAVYLLRKVTASPPCRQDGLFSHRFIRRKRFVESRIAAPCAVQPCA